MDEDWQRITGFFNGDLSAFEFIFNKYKNRVLNLSFGFLRERASAEDTAQEVFLKIYQKKLKPDPKAKFSTWLYRVTVNASFDILRRRKFTPDSLDRGIETSQGREKSLRDILPDLKASAPAKIVEREEISRLVRHEIDHLPEKLRSPLLLYQFEDMAYRDIALILGISEKAVERRLYHAREMLRKTLAPFL